MKTLGLIGGITWHSTAIYYQTINQWVNEKLGEHHAAQLILYSVNFNDFKKHQTHHDWHRMEEMLGGIAIKLECAGAEAIMLCSNTPHIVAPQIQQRIKIPFIHIAEVTAREIAKHGIKKIGLLGTKITMENSFFIEHLEAMGIETILPTPSEREWIHQSILQELSRGIFNQPTKTEYIKIINHLFAKGAEGIILGCTEIGMLIHSTECKPPLFDTTLIHAKAGVDFALSI
jgi:aspartate racemase